MRCGDDIQKVDVPERQTGINKGTDKRLKVSSAQ